MTLDPARFAATLLAEMPDAVVYADAAGKIRFWNRGAERVFGYPDSEALGQSLDLIVPESLRARHWAGFNHTMETGQTRYGAGDLLSVPAVRKDGARISVEFTVVPFHNADGSLGGIAAVMREVTARFTEMRALRQELASLKAGDRPG